MLTHKPSSVIQPGSGCGPVGGRPTAAFVTSQFASAAPKSFAKPLLSTKTISNQLVFLHGLFSYAGKRGWAPTNPVASVDRPRASTGDPDIRYLDLSELEALLRAVPDDYLGPTERALYLTAAMTGLRQGELAALRWLDVDWQAGRIRVRRNYTRQQFGTPKSKRSSRSVPLADRVAGELERHFQRSAFKGDEDLVFAHPQTGHPRRSTPTTRRAHTRPSWSSGHSVRPLSSKRPRGHPERRECRHVARRRAPHLRARVRRRRTSPAHRRRRSSPRRRGRPGLA